MEVKDIEAMKLEQGQRVEIRTSRYEARCGYFWRLELPPPPLPESPPGYRHVEPWYPIPPPYVEIAYVLGHNWTPTEKGSEYYKPDDIISITPLYTHREVELIFKKHNSRIPRPPTA